MRMGYWLESHSTYDNVSQNFYPVTQAIAIRDYNENERFQLTVMVPRTMAGGSHQPGRIELLHARRLLYDDAVSREIVLNETADPPLTTYVMQLFDRRYEEPMQRRVQAAQDAPVIPFYAYGASFKGGLVEDPMLSQPLLTTNELELAGLPLHLAGSCKMEYFPLNETAFLVRFENLADSDFDSSFKYYEDHEDEIDVPVEDEPEEVIPDYLDLDMLLALFIQKRGGGTMKIEEMSLTGAETYKDMQREKSKWVGLYDEWIDDTWVPKDPTHGGNLVTLEAQRIRMFRIVATKTQFAKE